MEKRLKTIICVLALALVFITGLLIGSSNVNLFKEANAAPNNIEMSSPANVSWGIEYVYGHPFVVFTYYNGGIYVIPKNW